MTYRGSPTERFFEASEDIVPTHDLIVVDVPEFGMEYAPGVTLSTYASSTVEGLIEELIREAETKGGLMHRTAIVFRTLADDQPQFYCYVAVTPQHQMAS